MKHSFAAYSDLRQALLEVGKELSRSGHARLYHDRIFAPDYETWSEVEFKAFFEANRNHNYEESWRLWASREDCSRFHGVHVEEQLDLFEKLARKASMLLDGIRSCNPDDVPAGFQCDLEDKWHRKNGWYGWLDLLHEYGRRFPTTKLLSVGETWAQPGEIVPNEFRKRTQFEQAFGTSASGVQFVLHPIVEHLQQNVFVASAELIQLFVDPEVTMQVDWWDGPDQPIRLPPFEDSCYAAETTESLVVPTLPTGRRVVLNECESNILEALGTNVLKGEELASLAGYNLNSNFRQTLSSLRKQGLIGNHNPGYFRTEVGRKALESLASGGSFES